MDRLKHNIKKFNNDVQENNGYLYNSNLKYSSIVSNKRITDEIFKLIPKNINSIIDIGCGDGTFSNSLKSRFPSIEVTGIDPADDAIEIAKKRYGQINFQVSDLMIENTLPKKKYNLGVLRGVLHHLPNALTGITNSKILSDSLIIVEPNGNNPILKLIERKSQYHIEHEEQSFNSEQLKKWIKQSGYKIEYYNYIGFVPFFFPTFLSKLIYFFQPLLEKIYPLKKYFGAQIVFFIKAE